MKALCSTSIWILVIFHQIQIISIPFSSLVIAILQITFCFERPKLIEIIRKIFQCIGCSLQVESIHLAELSPYLSNGLNHYYHHLKNQIFQSFQKDYRLICLDSILSNFYSNNFISMIELPSLNKHIYSRYVLLLSLQKMSLSFCNRVILSTILISTNN